MPDLERLLTERFRAALRQAFGEAGDVDPVVRPTQNPSFGDYQANVAMSLAADLGETPRKVAEQIVAELDLGDLSETPEIAGPGFINLRLTDSFLENLAGRLVADERLGVPPAERPEAIVIDYSHPNVARELHVGHLRSTIIGDALARTLEFVGHHVIRQNHIGDWGTQFGILIEHLIDLDLAEDAPLPELNPLYRRAQARFEEDEDFAHRARRRVVALQSGDPETLAVWRRLVETSTAYFQAIYDRLDVTLRPEHLMGESGYNPMLPEVVEGLRGKGILEESRGALVAFPPGFETREGDPLPLIVRKSDGGYLYATTDLAAVRYRIRDLGADRVIYVVDARQSQHLAMVFATARMAGWVGDTRLEHVPFGSVLGPDGTPLKTRAGESVRLAELLDEAVERAGRVVAEKNPDLGDDQQREVAEVVGIGAVKYADLSVDRVKDYVFDWNRMLAMDGNTAPYLQYAYARIRSIFRRGQVDEAELRDRAGFALSEPLERALLLRVARLPSTIAGLEQSLEPHRLCNHLYDLATDFSAFYEACPVLGAPDPATRHTRLILCHLTARCLELGLGLLGIRVLEEM